MRRSKFETWWKRYVSNCLRRLRFTMKCGGAALTLLLLTGWVGSNWWCIGATTELALQKRFAMLRGGRLFIGTLHDYYPQATQWFIHRDKALLPQFRWWFEHGDDAAATYIAIPLWIPLIIAATSTLLICWRDRRRDPNSCRKCGYDRTGLPADRACPECGAAVPETPR